MKFVLFNLKKDYKIIIKNVFALSLILVLALQVYGTYWFNYDYKKDQIIEESGLNSNLKDIEVNKIKDVVKLKKVNNINIKYRVDKKITSIDNLDINKLEEEMIDYGGINFASVIKKKFETKLYKGNLIDVFDGPNNIVIPAYLYEKYKLKLDEGFKINGKNLNITGVAASEADNKFILSLETAKDIGLNNLKLTIKPIAGLSPKELEDFISKAENILGSKVNLPSFEEYTNDGNYEIFMFLILIILISIFNLVLIYNSYLEQREDRRSIYKTEGLSLSRMFTHQLIEQIVIFTVSAFVTLILVELVNKIIFRSILKINRYNLPLTNYLLIFVVYFVVYLIAISASNRKLFRKS